MKKSILFSLLTILLPLGLRAQGGAHWQYNAATQYTMTVWAVVELAGTSASTAQLNDMEIAAFCGNECRGVVDGSTFQTAGSNKVLQLNVHSDVASGETITFKYYLKGTQEEGEIKSASVTFADNTNAGMPSSPITLKVKPPYTPGDTNGDGEVDLTDASLVFRYYSEFFEDSSAMAEAGLVFVYDAADVNGDGWVDLTDASLIFRYYSEFFEDVDAMTEAGLTVLIPSK